MSTDPNDVRLHFEGGQVHGHSIDVETICDTLQGLQKSLRMLASIEVEGWDGNRLKYRPSGRIIEQVTLRTSAPEPGSIIFPLVVFQSEQVPSRRMPSGGNQNFGRRLWERLDEVFDWIAEGASDQPPVAGPALEHLLKSFQEWLPKKEGLTISLRRGHPAPRRFSARDQKAVTAILEARTIDDLTLKGEITHTKPPEGLVKLKFPHLGRTMWVTLPPALRHEGIPQTGGQWLELEGRFRCNSWGEPLEPIDVVVRRPDLSTIRLARILLPSTGKPLDFSPPLNFAVELDHDTHQLYVVRDEELGIHVFAYSRPDLEAELVEQLQFLWAEFALADESTLAPSAQEVGRRLKARASRQAS